MILSGAWLLSGRFEHPSMANENQFALSRRGIWPQGAAIGDDLAPRLDSIEDRPEDVVTWSDVANFVRRIRRRRRSSRALQSRRSSLLSRTGLRPAAHFVRPFERSRCVDFEHRVTGALANCDPEQIHPARIRDLIEPDLPALGGGDRLQPRLVRITHGAMSRRDRTPARVPSPNCAACRETPA